MKCVKKVLKIAGIVIAVAGVIAGIYFAVKKFVCKKDESAECEENYVSCSCCEE